MSSRSEHSLGGPISKLPYDVLREIFIHGLPRYPLRVMHRQPDTTIAPMLLCQVCSFWRMVALTSASLWSHLSYHFTVTKVDADWAFFKNEIEFIRWWKINQGSIPPFLKLEMRFWAGNMDLELQSAVYEADFVLEFITSAEYLELGINCWDLIRKRVNAGYQFVCPNLRTLVQCGWDDDNFFYDAQVLTGFGRNRPHSTLLHLAIIDEELPYSNIIPAHWSTITHLSLDYIDIPLILWFPLIRAVPDLQWGYFYFKVVDVPKDYTPPTKWTTPWLSKLFIHVGEVSGQEFIKFPISMLFVNLHLPILHTLSLGSYEASWYDERAVNELCTIIQSTPTVTTLALRGPFLSLNELKYSTKILPQIGDIEPVWRHAPHLVHLQFELPVISSSDSKAVAAALGEVDFFLHNALRDSSLWLGLDTPTCPIQTITLVDKRPLDPHFERLRTFTMSSIRKYVQAPNVTFQVLSESPSRAASELWIEWGSRS